MQQQRAKEIIRLLDEARELFPDLLLALGSIDQLDPPPAIRNRITLLRPRLERLIEETRALEEASDCMPAADLGRRQNNHS